MRRWQKIVTTVWTTLIVSLPLVLCYAYSRTSCGEYDSCNTGGSLPFAGVAILLFLVLALLHAAFVCMIWIGTVDRTPD